MNPTALSLTQAHKLLRSKEISSLELVTAYLDRIRKYNSELNSYVLVNEEYAIAEAKKRDASGDFSHPLAGIPYALKDNFCSKESISQAGSHILDGFQAPYEATVVQKLREHGAIILGKTNTDEFTMGASTETSYFGPTKNPWDLSRVAGGSSGGSAAAVAADLSVFALGTDTGGSIRQPAALCGCVGLKPTYGRNSRYGVMPMVSSLDTIGPLTKTVEDTALLMQVLAGRDIHDSTTADVPVPDYMNGLKKDLKGLKIGLPQEYFVDGMAEGVKKSVNDAIEVLKKLGAEVIKVNLPHTKYALAVYHTVGPLEISANMARFDGIRYGLKGEGAKDLVDYYRKVRNAGFGEEVKIRITIGRLIDAIGYADKFYKKARQVQALMKRDFDQAFEKVDILVAPTSPTVAFKIGEKTHDPVAMYLSDIFTMPINLTAMPAISVPCGMSEDLPVGLQFIGKQFDEETVLRAAHQYEKAVEWSGLKPSLLN